MNTPIQERHEARYTWGGDEFLFVEVDEAMFLGGLEKSRFLREFEPDFFFDDQTRHCEPASRLVPTGHVVSGVANQG